MPSNPIPQTSGVSNTATSGLISTSIATGTATASGTITATGGFWASGTTMISYDTTGTSNFSNSSLTTGGNYRYSKDGEVRIDPETGESLIYLSDYNEWFECDILELKKTIDKDGNKKNIISVSFELSVSKLKMKQLERIVLFEKVKKSIDYIISSFGSINTCGTTGTITIGNNYLTYPYVTGGYNNTAGGYNNIAIGTNYTTNYTTTNTITTGTNIINLV